MTTDGHCPSCWAPVSTRAAKLCPACHALALLRLYSPHRRALATRTTLPSDLTRRPARRRVRRPAWKDAPSTRQCREFLREFARRHTRAGTGYAAPEDMSPGQETALRRLEDAE